MNSKTTVSRSRLQHIIGLDQMLGASSSRNQIEIEIRKINSKLEMSQDDDKWN